MENLLQIMSSEPSIVLCKLYAPGVHSEGWLGEGAAAAGRAGNKDAAAGFPAVPDSMATPSDQAFPRGSTVSSGADGHPRFQGIGSLINAPTQPPAPDPTALVPRVTRAGKPRRRFISQIPVSISENAELLGAMESLPLNYNFEIPKTIWRLHQLNAQTVALQFPEGLLLYATTIADILERFAGVDTIIMGDVTYGACCIDDLAAAALDAQLLVHYGHSCLVPIDRESHTTHFSPFVTLPLFPFVTRHCVFVGMACDVLYVFVEIHIDAAHVVATLKANFDKRSRIAFCATIQFAGALHAIVADIEGHFAGVQVPQCKPLSAGETLGCTAPTIVAADVCVFLADGRFHPEAVMIQNPHLPLYRYDPYAKKITREEYEHVRSLSFAPATFPTHVTRHLFPCITAIFFQIQVKMKTLRSDAVRKATGCTRWGLVLGTLGRQGNPDILRHIQQLLTRNQHSYVTILLSEVFPSKLRAFPNVEAWIQVCCPRLSIDWGHGFEMPLLSPYEAEVALGARTWIEQYPMDYYAKGAGSWGNYASEEAREATRAGKSHPPISPIFHTPFFSCIPASCLCSRWMRGRRMCGRWRLCAGALWE